MNHKLAWGGLALLATSIGLGFLARTTLPAKPWWMAESVQVQKTPSPGDLRAISVSYPTGNFEPAWTIESAREAQAMRAALPNGIAARRSGNAVNLDPMVFTPLGPQPLNPGNSAASGRVNDIVVDPSDPAIAYFGSDGGGVWKTTNCCSAATTWTVKTDFPEIASMAIGDLEIDPSNPNVVYAGTGDLRFGSFSFGAAGLLRSADKGETWTVLGADVFNPFYGPSANGFPQYQAIGKVVVDPNNSANLIVGTKTGIYFSYDTGANWSGPCLTNAHTTQRQDTTGLLAIDLGASTELIAAIGTRGTPTPVQPDLANNGANGVYRATMPASGCPASWNLLNNNWPANTGNGVSGATTVGRIELAVAPSNNQVLYAMISDTNLENGVLGVWKSVDRGTAWTQIGSSTAFGGCASEGRQMWYDAGLTVDPNNENIVIASAVDAFKSTNGGSSFNNLTCGYQTGNVHVDHHARAYVGGDSSRLLLGSDGGMWYSSNANAASPTFIPLNNSINTIEFYSGDITANFATSANPGISGGAQDNGSNVTVFGSVVGPSSWVTRWFGDGIYTRIDPIVRPGGLQRWYYSSQFGNIVADVSGPGESVQQARPNWGTEAQSQFLVPIEIYKYGVLDAPNSGCTTADGCRRLLAGTTRVWESITGGIGGSSWYINSPTLTKTPSPLGTRGFINQLAHAVSNPSFAIAGTSDGNVQWGRNLGQGSANTATWVNLTGNNAVLPNRPVMDVATDPLQPLIGYAAIGGFDQNTPATPGHVFQVTCTTNCATFTWANKTGNLPNIPANSIVANPHAPNQVFVGTDWGLYFTDDISVASPVWSRHEGLPHVMVWDMAIDRGFTTLAVFTRSRGAWAWPLPAPPTDGLFQNGFESP